MYAAGAMRRVSPYHAYLEAAAARRRWLLSLYEGTPTRPAKSMSQIARELSISRQAVSQAIKKARIEAAAVSPKKEAAMDTASRSRVPDLLRARGWDAMRLAREAGIAHSTARRLADGATGPFRITTLQKAARALGVEWWPWLFEETGVGAEIG